MNKGPDADAPGPLQGLETPDTLGLEGQATSLEVHVAHAAHTWVGVAAASGCLLLGLLDD